MKSNINDLLQIFKRTLTGEFKKLLAQKILLRYLLFFAISELVIISILAFYNYRLSILNDPVETLEEFHSMLFSTGFTVFFIFAGSQQICREFELGVIKNISLTGISLPVYMFSRLIGFIIIFVVYLLLTYILGLMLVVILFSTNLNIELATRGFLLNSMNMVYTIFIVVMAGSLSKVAMKSIRFLLFYYIGFEKIFINSIIGLKSLLNIPEWVITLAGYSPLHVLENITNTFSNADIFMNIFILCIYLLTYGAIIWGMNRTFQIALVNK